MKKTIWGMFVLASLTLFLPFLKLYSDDFKPHNELGFSYLTNHSGLGFLAVVLVLLVNYHTMSEKYEIYNPNC